jgi:hypothetical protein
MRYTDGMETADEEGERIVAAHAALVAEGLLEPLSADEGETGLWLDWQIASLVENRFFVSLDPLAMTPEIRASWEARASSGEPLSSPHGQRWYRATYWIRDGGTRAGTLALSTKPAGDGTVLVSSLYVLPSRRRCGVAGRALRRAHAAVTAAMDGFAPRAGLRVGAYWTWQPAVRFYLGLGLWVAAWTHDLLFALRDDLPPFRVEVEGDHARFGVLRHGGLEPLLAAERRGETLGWTEQSGLAAHAGSDLACLAVQTFSVALAVRGFPLVRSLEAWEQRHAFRDGGAPEGLALMIDLFERRDRRDGYEVRTPRASHLRDDLP